MLNVRIPFLDELYRQGVGGVNYLYFPTVKDVQSLPDPFCQDLDI